MKSKVICVIMGGGRGTRLHPLTKDRCKPAVPLAGKYRLVDIPISNCLNSSYNQIFVLTQFNTASLHQHIQSTYKFDPFGKGFVDILSAEQTYSGENWYQGTADAVRQNMHHFSYSDQDLFLILSGDQLYNLNLEKIVEHHKSLKADVTIAAKALTPEEVKGLGVMRVSTDYSIKEFVEKPTDPELIKKLVVEKSLAQKIQGGDSKEFCLASMGIYVFNASVLKDTLDTHGSDFGKEIIPGMLGKKSLKAYIFDGYWEDIGTVKAFFEANLMLNEPIPSFNFYDRENPVYTRSRFLPSSKLDKTTLNRTIVSDGCILIGCSLNNCSIGLRSVVGEGSDLEDVVMLGADNFESLSEIAENKKNNIPNIGVGKNCKIEKSIIDKNARIGDFVELSPKGKKNHFELNGVYVRDEILIVTKNAIIPNGTIL